MEAVYLSKHAGFSTAVVDRKKSAPAGSLCDSFNVADIVKEPEAVRKVLSDCDAVIPACEELDALHALDAMMKELEKPFVFDMRSYEISCSKEKSNEFMAKAGVPMPLPWPECGFPMVVKPSSQSGSIGVTVARDEQQRLKGLKGVERLNDVPIQQEFVSGKSVSVEVIGNGSSSRSYVTTEVVLDYNYDCKQVVCKPDILPPEDDAALARIGEDIGNAIGLDALMDVEAIYTSKGLRVLEIDARIPSQTPAAICAATGINLLEEAVFSKMGKETGKTRQPGCSIYEHFVISDGIIRTCGEKEFGHVDRPYLQEDFFGADEAITDYGRDRHQWRVTTINRGNTMQECLHKRREFITGMMKDHDLDEFIDKSPEMM